MNLPEIYSTILESNKSLKGIVYSTVETYSEILTENKLYFFEEYTDHGIAHIESILISSLDLLPEQSLKAFLDAENTAALILSVILHDLGMHMTYHSFLHLISQKEILFPDLDEFSWHELWENYTEEAKKFNSQQKYELFGDYDYVVSIPKFLDQDDLDGHQRKLIGEFIRRHHPRIAHEIAIKGFSTGFNTIKFAEAYGNEKLDIVGLIARSHGIEIRKTYDYLKERFYELNRTPNGIHVYYLMVIVRISDYFQIDINRISLVSLKLKKFKSKISEIEHAKHFSIKEIRAIDEDPETLFIRATPESSSVYCKLYDLIKDIQSELDKSWAIIGEKYGKELIRPLLKYRRIVSNLDLKSYKESINFIPDKIEFSADQDLSKLLVAPLYGNNPTFGVRELIQNATDAIHERMFQENLSKDFQGLINVQISHDSNEEYFFEIKDNGKGMSVAEIKNYFLKAGATNRKSKEWDELYIDSEMNTAVLKSGKFGVGILAAFLIGDELSVTTRRFDSKKGLSFIANINSKDIEISKKENVEIGTTIRIGLKKGALESFKNLYSTQLPWHKWYTLKDPRIEFNCLLEFNAKYGYTDFNPSFFEENSDWVDFHANGYSKLRWSYVHKETLYNSHYQLTCNGLIIPNPPLLKAGAIKSPHIQVFDFNGVLPVNLNRNSLDCDILPFEKELIKSIFKEVLIRILKIYPEILINEDHIQILKKPERLVLFGHLNVNEFYSGFAYTSTGFYIKNRYLTDITKDFKHLQITISDEGDTLHKLSLKIDSSYTVKISNLTNSAKIQGYINLDSTNSFIDWMIIFSEDKNTDWIKNNKGYIVEHKTIRNRQYTILRKDHIKISFNLGSLNEFELSKLHSIVCFSKLRYSIGNMNNEFDKFLSQTFSHLEECILPYDDEIRAQKINDMINAI